MKQRVLSFDGLSLQRTSVEAPGPLRWAAWSVDGERALLVGDRGSLLVYKDGAFRLLRSPGKENLRCVAVSPADGVAYACGNDGEVIRIVGEDASATGLRLRENLRRLAWDSAGKELLLVGNNGAAFTLHPPDSTKKLPGAETHLRSVSWHPKKETTLITGNCFRDSIGGLTPSPNLFEFEGGSLREVSTLEESRSDLTASSWHPSGSSCLLAGFDQTWHSATLLTYSDGTTSTVDWEATNTLPTACSWKPDGAYALIGTSAMTEEEGSSALYRYDGRTVTKLEDLEGFGVSCIAWSGETAIITCSRTNRAFTS